MFCQGPRSGVFIPGTNPVKALTVLFLLLSLVLPGSLVSQAMAVPVAANCSVVSDTGDSCCPPAAPHCCCDATPSIPEVPVQPLPPPPVSSGAKDMAASLPVLYVLEELPRQSLSAPNAAPFSDRIPFALAPPVRLCVLRCSLLI